MTSSTIPQTILGSPAPLSGTDWVERGILTPLPPRTFEMLVGDPVLSGDPEPDKTPTATVVRGRAKGAGRREPPGEGAVRRWAPVLLAPELLSPSPQTSETSHWSGPSSEGPAPLTGRGALRPEGWGQKGSLPLTGHHQLPVLCTRDMVVHTTDLSTCPQSGWTIVYKSTKGCFGEP